MQALSIVVAAFSALSLWVWSTQGDFIILLLSLSSAALAVTTWLSLRISTYLRIFSTIFAVETVLFGLCAFAVKWGWWPAFLSGAQIPDTLVLTVSVFGWLVFGDVPQIHVLIGAAIIVGAGLFIFFREQKLKKAPPEVMEV